MINLIEIKIKIVMLCLFVSISAGGGGGESSLCGLERDLEAELSWIGERERALDGIEGELGRIGSHPSHSIPNSRTHPSLKLKVKQLSPFSLF